MSLSSSRKNYSKKFFPTFRYAFIVHHPLDVSLSSCHVMSCHFQIITSILSSLTKHERIDFVQHIMRVLFQNRIFFVATISIVTNFSEKIFSQLLVSMYNISISYFSKNVNESSCHSFDRFIYDYLLFCDNSSTFGHRSIITMSWGREFELYRTELWIEYARSATTMFQNISRIERWRWWQYTRMWFE